MTVGEVIAAIEEVAPLTWQESWDNSGLQVGNKAMPVSDVLLCIDVTEAVVDEAIGLGCQLIVSHHPLLFKGLKTLQGTTYTERCLLKAVKHDIAIYSAHTNMDNWQSGVSAAMGAKLGLQGMEVLAPQHRTDGMTVGSGIVGRLPQPEELSVFLHRVKEVFGVACVRYSDPQGKPIEMIALCGGAGSFLVPDAIERGADLFLTADMKYHDFFLADNRIVIADIGHYESEQFAKELFFELISKKIPTFAIHFAATDRSPVNYL